MDDDLKRFGEDVREQRKAQNLNQEELADRVGISRTYLSQIEQGRATNLSFRLAQKLSVILGLEPPREPVVKVPPSLRQFAEEDNLPPEHVGMLARIAYRGKQPEKPEQWRMLYNLIKTTLESYQ